MVETVTGTNRSAGMSYDEVLDTDTHPVPGFLRGEGRAGPVGPDHVDVKLYYDRAIADLEVERIWKKVWQLACHESDIPNVGDAHVYSVATLSYVVVRTGPDAFAAFPNACLHRGRALLDDNKKELKLIRCPFHGWSWELDGTLKQVPGHWDFPDVSAETHSLSCVKIGRWGGFLFINPDKDAEPFDDFLGDFVEHWPTLKMENSFKAVHVAKVLPCNWKIAQEAFAEAYHVVATHPTLLTMIGDVNSKYDAYGNYSRAISPHALLSPHLSEDDLPTPLEDETTFGKKLHVMSGNVYERLDDNRVRVSNPGGKTGTFSGNGDWIEGEIKNADPHMCRWVGGMLNSATTDIPEDASYRDFAQRRAEDAANGREQMRAFLGETVDQVSDAEMVDSIYYSVFPNINPWGGANPIFYRFLPYGDDPEMSVHETMFMLPLPPGMPRPPAAPIKRLGVDDDYVQSLELSTLAKVFQQDSANLKALQKGIRNVAGGKTTLGNYQETKIRHFYELWEKWMGLKADDASAPS